MLHVGNFKSRTCAGLNRRSFLKLSTGLPLAFSAAGIPRLAQAADERKAKSVILLWLWGAPSHLDLVDPKPQAPTEYRGPFCPIQTKTPGLQFTELLPRLSQRTDQFTLIRSMVSSNGGHPGAGTVGLTGFEESPGPVQPNFGSIISKSQTQPGDLPPFFYVGRGIPRDLPRRIKGYGGGTLGPAHDPLIVPPCPSRADSPPHPQAWLLRASGFPRAASPPRSRPRKRPRPAPLPPVRRTLLHASTDRTRRPWRASSTGSHGRFGARRATQPKLATGSVMCAGYIRRIISAPQNSPSDPPEQPTCPASSSSWPSPPPRSPSPG